MTDGKDKNDKPAALSLSDDEISTQRGVNRRGVLRGIGTGALGATFVGASARMAEAVTDTDNGNITDPGGRGRGYCRSFRSGVTDQDNGTWRDPGGNGRGGNTQRAGITDRDNGSWTDPGGNGRGAPRNFSSGMTDSDYGGNCSDPGGNGRG